MGIRTHVELLVDDVRDAHGLGRATRLSASLVDAVIGALSRPVVRVVVLEFDRRTANESAIGHHD